MDNMNAALKIPGTDLNVSRIGLGMATAGLSRGGDADSFRLMDEYTGMGGNLIDTARVYSDWVAPEVGRSERVIGDWLRKRGHRGDVVILTKGAHPRLQSMRTSRLSREEVRGDLELSLRALGTDCIDIYCYHRDDVNRPAAELIETMEGFRREGKIRYYACSNWSAARMREADAYCKEMGYRGFILNEALFCCGCDNMKPLSDPTLEVADGAMLAYHRENPANVLTAYMSLASGFFTKLDQKGEQAVAESPFCTPENVKRLSSLREIASAHGATVLQAVLGYTLTRRPEMIALAGPGSVEHLREVMGTLSAGFRPEDYGNI